MSSAITLDIESILAPATAGPAAGIDLRYAPAYDAIKAARKLAESGSQFDDTVKSAASDVVLWKKVASLSADAIRQSKDLQLGVWLLEALARVDGYRGAATGFTILRRMVADFWETLYPALDPDDSDPLSYRTSFLNWPDERLPQILKTAPLTPAPSGYGVLHYEVTLKTGDEKKAIMEDGRWPTSERFEQALNAPVEHLQDVVDGILACQAELAALQTVVDARYAAVTTTHESPSFVHVRETLATAQHLVERPLRKKRGDAAPDGAAGDGVPSSRPGLTALNTGDEVWSQALSLTRESRIEGLRLLQDQVAAAIGGRDRFLKQLQLSELCLEGGIYALAYPIFEELAKTIDDRKLEEWEDRALLTRVWTGVAHCCDKLDSQIPSARARADEMRGRLAGSQPIEAPSE